jgi:hypothetical protein
LFNTLVREATRVGTDMIAQFANGPKCSALMSISVVNRDDFGRGVQRRATANSFAGQRRPWVVIGTGERPIHLGSHNRVATHSLRPRRSMSPLSPFNMGRTE